MVDRGAPLLCPHAGKIRAGKRVEFMEFPFVLHLPKPRENVCTRVLDFDYRNPVLSLADLCRLRILLLLLASSRHSRFPFTDPAS